MKKTIYKQNDLTPLIHSTGPDTLLYRRQFVAAPDHLEVPQYWQKINFADRLRIYHHPELAAAFSKADDQEFVLLGDAFDPSQPAANGQDIVDSLVRNATSFESFEDAIAELAGRFLVFVRIKNHVRIYQDATGLQSLFYISDAQQPLLIASQPRLINEFVQLRWQEDIASIINRRYLPFKLSPYFGVKPLLPNHYLDFASRETVRFWPRKNEIQPRSLSLHQIAEEIGWRLVGTVTAIAQRGRFFLPLSGGRDSRMLLAAFLAAGIQPPTGSFRRPNAPRYDVSIPRRLSRRLKFPYERLRIAPPTKQLLDTYRVNTGGIFWDPSVLLLESQRKLFSATEFGVSGAVAEVFRSFYHPNDRAGAELSAGSICATIGFEQHPLIIKEIEEWLVDALDRMEAINVWDLLYWEHRLGNWASLGLTGRDTAVRMIPPFNNRALLQIALSAGPEKRSPPYGLVDCVCETLCPGVLSEPFNFSTYDSVVQSILPLLPFRLRRALEIGSWTISGLNEVRGIREGTHK